MCKKDWNFGLFSEKKKKVEFYSLLLEVVSVNMAKLNWMFGKEPNIDLPI